MIRLATQVIAYAFVFASMWLCGRKSLWGPALGVIGTIPWCALAIQSNTPSMVLFEVILGVLEVRMFYMWAAGRMIEGPSRSVK